MATSPHNHTTRTHPDDVHQLAATKLAANGQRYTTSRRMVIDALLRGDGPLAISGILDNSDGLAQSSAYRNLVLLEEANIVKRIVVSDDFARYELTEEVTGYHHHHLICQECGAILDVNLPDEVERLLDKALSEEANNVGFVESYHRVDLLGSCKSCAEN